MAEQQAQDIVLTAGCVTSHILPSDSTYGCCTPSRNVVLCSNRNERASFCLLAHDLLFKHKTCLYTYHQHTTTHM